jgi:hypothetical protein
MKLVAQAHNTLCLRRVIRQQGSQHGLAWQPAHLPHARGCQCGRSKSAVPEAPACGASAMQEVRTSQRTAAKGKGDGLAQPEQQPASQASYFPQAAPGSAQQLANFWAQANGQVGVEPLAILFVTVWLEVTPIQHARPFLLRRAGAMDTLAA